MRKKDQIEGSRPATGLESIQGASVQEYGDGACVGDELKPMIEMSHKYRESKQDDFKPITTNGGKTMLQQLIQLMLSPFSAVGDGVDQSNTEQMVETTNKNSKGARPMLNRLKLIAVLPVLLAVSLLFTSIAEAQPYGVYSGADTSIINGWWDGGDSTASQPGQMTFEIAGVYGGIPADSLQPSDTVVIDSAFSFSSLESLGVNDTTAQNYDTVWFQYHYQNQGNIADSFEYTITLVDTSDASSFTPVDFDIFASDSMAELTDSVSVDTIRFGKKLTQDAIDTFLIRLVVPSPLTASNEDTLRFRVNIKDSLGTGGYDAWPDTVPGGYVHRYMIDTTNGLLHTHGDTLWEYGDDQTVINYIAIAAPIMRLAKSVSKTGNLPGDTLTYTVKYENDGSAATQDTVNIIDQLPLGTMFLDTIQLAMDSGRGSADSIDVDYYYTPTGVWLEDQPTSSNKRDTLLWISAVRFQIPPGVGANDTTGDGAGAGDSTNHLVADGDSLDKDAGFVKFSVRVR